LVKGTRRKEKGRRNGETAAKKGRCYEKKGLAAAKIANRTIRGVAGGKGSTQRDGKGRVKQ